MQNSAGHHPPAFMEYPGRNLLDDQLESLTTLEFGAYNRLKQRAWCEKPICSIPTDDRVLARWARLTAEQWAECRDAVLACFKPHKGRLFEPRLQEEHRRLVLARKQKSEAGKKGAESRWPKNDGNAIAAPCECHSIKPNNPETPNNPVTQNKDLNKTHGGCRGDAAANATEPQPPGSSTFSFLGSRVPGLLKPSDIPWESLNEEHMFSVFRDLFLDNSIPSVADLCKKVRKSKVTPVQWTMLFFDKLQYAEYEEGSDPVALTIAGFRHKHSPSDSAAALVREIVVDKAGSPDGSGKRFSSLNAALITAELEKRKGKQG